MNNYNSFVAMLSSEFHRYLIENKKVTEQIPANALIIFQVEGDDDFNNWHKETSLKNREAGQPTIYIYVKRWRKHSLIEKLNVAKAAA